jgi:hypothetical protein
LIEKRKHFIKKVSLLQIRSSKAEEGMAASGKTEDNNEDEDAAERTQSRV